MILLLLSSFAISQSHINWSFAPKIVICKNESQTKHEIVNKAKKYWQARGYSLGDITEKKCDKEIYSYGEIRFAGERSLDTNSYFGLTNRGYANGNVVSGYIQLANQDANNLELVTHELGHALGVQHNDIKSDLMYEYHMYENTDGF